MDPLSITASAVGLLTAVASVAKTIRSITAVVKDAPREVHSLQVEVDELQTAVAGLNEFMGRASQLPKHRTSLISVDQLVATLTEAVLIISEIESLLKPIKSGIFTKTLLVQDRLRFISNQGTISMIIQRIQRSKASLNLMFNIVQW